MNIIFDIGNSSYKIAIFADKEIVFRTRLEVIDTDILGDILSKYFPSKAIISSTRPIPEYLTETLVAHDVDVTLFSKDTLPFKIDYNTPETLGSDRVAAIAGGRVLFPHTDLLVIDSGTAITFDYLTDDTFQGGNISLGIRTRFKALNHYTAHLPLVSIPQVVNSPGKSTTEAIEAGVIFGVLFEINEYIRTFLKSYTNGKVILTGGDGEYLKDKLGNDIVYVPDVVMVGLNNILENDAK